MKENIIFIFLSLAYYGCLQLHPFLYESHNFVFFVAEEGSVVYLPSLVLTLPSVDEHLGWVHALAVLDDAT